MSRQSLGRDFVPFILVGVFALALGFSLRSALVTTSTPAIKRPVLSNEALTFRDRYGPAKYSSHDEELFVRDFFQDSRGRFFVDVGASDARIGSNTYYLEQELGWSGIAVDPIQDFAPGYAKHRPRTRFFPVFISNMSDRTATLYVGANSLFSSADKAFTDSFTGIRKAIESPTITLTDLLSAQKVAAIDFLTIDIELHEPQALAGFDVQRFRPALVCIESHPEVRQQILDYFHANGYRVVGKYLRADPQNLWFSPGRPLVERQ